MMRGHKRILFRLMFALVLLGLRFAPDAWSSPAFERIRGALASDETSKLDQLLSQVELERADQGYYDRLIEAGTRPDQPPPICISVDDLREVILRPNLAITRANGSSWRTSALGIRDQDYAPQKPRGTFRIAMTGDSIGVGLGVSDGQGFEPLVEEQLALESLARGGPDVEILNFAMPGRSPGQRWTHFRQVAWETDPDVVFFEATAADIGWDARRLAELLPRGIGWDAPIYGGVLRSIRLPAAATADAYRTRLEPLRWRLLEAAYRAIAADCRARGVPCVWILIPRVGRAVPAADHDRLVALARDAGFTAIVDVSDAFDGHDPADLALHESDFHPNALGHAILAERLAPALAAVPELASIRDPELDARE